MQGGNGALEVALIYETYCVDFIRTNLIIVQLVNFQMSIKTTHVLLEKIFTYYMSVCALDSLFVDIISKSQQSCSLLKGMYPGRIDNGAAILKSGSKSRIGLNEVHFS